MEGSTTNNIFKLFSFSVLLVIIFIIITIIVSGILSIKTAYNLHQSKEVGMHNQDKCGEYFLEGETARYLIYKTYKDNIEEQQKTIISILLYMFLVIVIIITLISCIVFGIVFSKRDSICHSSSLVQMLKCKNLLISAIIALLYIGVFIFSVLSRSKLNYKISLLINSVSEKSKLIKNQLGYMLSILGFNIIVYLIYRFFILSHKELEINGIDNINNSILMIIIANILLVIFTPIISSSIFKLDKNLGQYYNKEVINIDNNESLNSLINRDYEVNDDLHNHLRINIQRLENLEELPIIDDEYKEILYKYVMHSTNIAELRNIIIPEQLAIYINKEYLRGDNIIILKKDLLNYYNGVITSKKLSKYLNENTTKNREKLNNLLNKYVKNNDSYKMSNNITPDIRNKLLLLRQNMLMEKTVDDYYKNTKIITYLVCILIFYMITHKVYNINNDRVKQLYAFFILFIMILLGNFGWLFKELWL